MNDFETDDMFQRRKRDEILLPEFYGKVTMAGRFVLMDKGRFADIMQKREAVDTIAQRKNGEVVTIEEKIVRWPGYHYTCFALETDSCTNPGYESPGWMEYGQPDWLLYCFEQDDGALACHLVDFPTLKAWFWPRVEEFEVHTMPTKNRSRIRKVPIKRVREETNHHWIGLLGNAALSG